MSKTPTFYRRKNYFIEKEFQAKFILKFCLLTVVGGFLTIGLVYFLASQATTVSIINSRVVVRSTADFILPVLVQTVAVVVIFIGLSTIFVTLFFSHKIAGPLYRFKKILETLEGGDFSRGFNIRELDQLQMLARSLNQVIIKNGQKLADLKDEFSSLGKKLEELISAGPDEQKNRIAELKNVFLDAKKKLDHFKTA